ncbi:MAG TPA: hypothetical protein VHV56_08170 [Pseudolabrys sp.]|jgi:hypothetical protein|nr:hypothetical protein [Pseudolabrys sp.]
MRIAAIILFACASIACPAKAASVGDVFHAFGLFGAWAGDCAAQASPANPHVSISEPATGLVLETHDLGEPYAKNRYTVLTATKVSPTELSVEVIFQSGFGPQERQKLVFRVRGDTRRTMFNQPEGGPVRVRGGIALARGVKTPVLHKCK